MGRDKNNERRGEHFARLTRALMETKAWRALSPTAQALYPWLLLEWRGKDANNNGKICLSVRQAAAKMGVSKETASRAFHDLQAKGFIVVRSMARLGFEGEARSTQFELTDVPAPGVGGHGRRRLYLQWRSGSDFEVRRAQANNPTGRRKRNPRLGFEDSSV